MESKPYLKYYVYALCHPDGTPFYIGKGSGKRVENHEASARLGETSNKSNIIRSIWANGQEVIKQILFTTDNSQQALVYESEQIAKHIKTGKLCNVTFAKPIVRGLNPNAHNANAGTINGQWLLDALKALEETQTSAAAKLNKEKSYFTKHIKGRSYLNAESLAELAKQFPTLNLRYVLTGEGSPLL